MTRRASLILTYEGKNITQDIAGDVLSFGFTEHADKKSDEVSLTISDPERKWQDSWAPSHGDVIRPVIRCENWFEEGDSYVLNCGVFEVDEDELDSSGDGDRVTIKAKPAGVKSSLADQRKTRSWESVSLERLGRDIAQSAGLELVYRADPITLKRVDQRQESDLTFLQRIATDQGLRLRIAHESLVLFSGAAADAMNPFVLTRSSGDSFRGKRSKTDVYSKVQITFSDPKTGKKLQYEYAPDNAPKTGKVLTLNERCESPAHAQRRAIAALRAKNQAQKTAEWSGMGNPLARAGGTVSVSGWGVYDGKYSIETAAHTIDGQGSYTLSLTLKFAQGY